MARRWYILCERGRMILSRNALRATQRTSMWEAETAAVEVGDAGRWCALGVRYRDNSKGLVCRGSRTCEGNA